MKLILAILPADDASVVVDALTHQEVGVTRINTVGGFLKKGNATLLIGVDETKVASALDLITTKAKQGRTFVIDVERYERI
ncbi:MAG: cyclic-di-AMP receptor [Chloroflexota bacterium]